MALGVHTDNGDDMITTKDQVGGTHYKDKGIQPIEYIQTNKLSFCEGNVIKYVTRHRDKNGLEDLKKAMQYLKFLMESEYQYVEGENKPERPMLTEEEKYYEMHRVREEKAGYEGCATAAEAPLTYRDAATKCGRNLPFDDTPHCRREQSPTGTFSDHTGWTNE